MPPLGRTIKSEKGMDQLNMARPIVRIENLVKYFPVSTRILLRKKVGDVHAVDDISLKIGKGETLGLVGESGYRKTTGKVLLDWSHPILARFSSKGRKFTKRSAREPEKKKRYLRRNMQMVFQNPYGSLDFTT